MPKFNKGDIVRDTTTMPHAPRWQNCEVLNPVPNMDGYIRVQNLGYPNTGAGLIKQCNLALVPPYVIPDQELADKYRALRDEATVIGKILVSRGYTPEVKVYDRTTWSRVHYDRGPQYRFTKTDTVTTTTHL